MKLEERLARRRELALLEVQALVSMHQISLAELDRLDEELAQRRKALDVHIAEVRTLMADHEITLEEILDDVPADACRVTHRHPVSGETWNGIGAQPEWLRSALLSEGYRPADLRVAGTPFGDGTTAGAPAPSLP